MWNDSTDKFIREPFIAEFYHNSRIYWLINTHILFKNGNKEGMNKRRSEVKGLGKVYSEISRNTKSGNQFVIILGDFNLPKHEINMLGLPFQSYNEFNTTISYKKGCYNNNYDHFCLSQDHYQRLKPK